MESLFVYSPTLVKKDSEDTSKKLLYFYPESVQLEEREMTLSLVEGLVGFSNIVTSQELYTGVFQLSKTYLYVLESEPGVYFVMESKSSAAELYQDKLRAIANITRLFVGPILQRIASTSVPSTRCLIYRVISDIIYRALPSGINYLPISTASYLECLNIIHQMRVDAAGVADVVISIGPYLLFSSLALEDTASVYALGLRALAAEPPKPRPAECVMLAHLDDCLTKEQKKAKQQAKANQEANDHETSSTDPPTDQPPAPFVCPVCGEPTHDDITGVTPLRTPVTMAKEMQFYVGPMKHMTADIWGSTMDYFTQKKVVGQTDFMLNFPQIWVKSPDGALIERKLALMRYNRMQIGLILEEGNALPSTLSPVMQPFLSFSESYHQWLITLGRGRLEMLTALEPRPDASSTVGAEYLFMNKLNGGFKSTIHGTLTDDDHNALARCDDESLHVQYIKNEKNWVVVAQNNGRRLLMKPEATNLVDAHMSLKELDRSVFRAGDAGLFEIE